MAFHQDEAFVTFSFVCDSDGRVAMRTNDALLNHLRTIFSVVDKNAISRRRFTGNRFIATRRYVISPTGRFRFGILRLVVSEIRKCVANPIFSLDNKFRAHYPKKMADALGLGLPELSLQFRQYQSDGITSALKQGCGILLYPTGSGKTLIMGGLIRNILDASVNSRVLVVTLTHLVEQTANSLVDYGFKREEVSMWTGGREFVPARVVICGPQILNSAMKNVEKYSEAIDFMSKVEAFLVDEVHQCKRDNKISDFEKYVKTTHRFGFTGTLPEDKIDEWNVIGMFGPVISTVSREQLVSEGSITGVVICEVQLHYGDAPKYERKGVNSGIRNFRIEQEFLYSSDFRNKTVCGIAAKTKKNCLLLVDRIEHGETLYNMLKSSCDKEVYFIRGSVEGEVREEIRKLIEFYFPGDIVNELFAS